MVWLLVAALWQTIITDAHDAALIAPAAIVEVDTGKLKGDPGMLAWSPDGQSLYLQMNEHDRKGTITSTRHYVIAIAEKKTAAVDSQPAWVGPYWAWKAAPASPVSPLFTIVPEEREETTHAVGPAGDLAKGGSTSDARGMPGTSTAEAVAVAATAQKLHIWALKIKGETIGEWVNEGVTPGVNFSWAPAPAHLIVYAKRDGGPLSLLDDSGRKQALNAAKNASFPAWSADGGRIAWLEKKDRRKYDVMIGNVSAK